MVFFFVDFFVVFFFDFVFFLEVFVDFLDLDFFAFLAGTSHSTV